MKDRKYLSQLSIKNKKLSSEYKSISPFDTILHLHFPSNNFGNNVAELFRMKKLLTSNASAVFSPFTQQLGNPLPFFVPGDLTPMKIEHFHPNHG